MDRRRKGLFFINVQAAPADRARSRSISIENGEEYSVLAYSS
jgi:hypothetical protein